MDNKLTPKQRAFADYYIETGNATEAARRAGYKKPNVQGSQNLEKLSIKSYIEERVKASDEKRIAKGEEVLEYLTKVMRGEEKDQFGLDASLQDRTKAAELLGKRYRLFTEKVELEGSIPVQIVDDISFLTILADEHPSPSPSTTTTSSFSSFLITDVRYCMTSSALAMLSFSIFLSCSSI